MDYFFLFLNFAFLLLSFFIFQINKPRKNIKNIFPGKRKWKTNESIYKKYTAAAQKAQQAKHPTEPLKQQQQHHSHRPKRRPKQPKHVI